MSLLSGSRYVETYFQDGVMIRLSYLVVSSFHHAVLKEVRMRNITETLPTFVQRVIGHLRGEVFKRSILGVILFVKILL